MTAMKRWIGCTVLMLMLLTGCASKTPVEPAAEPAPEMPVLEAREAYQLAEIPVQKLHDGDEVTVDGVCTFTVKGFGAGKTITADGSTCAGAKASQTLIWVTCSYMNLTQNEVSPGRLIENGTLQMDSGTSDGKSASFAQILPGEAAEIYIFYAIPDDLPEQPLTLQFTIGGQAYSYEVPADRSGALLPTLLEIEVDEKPDKTADTEPVTLQQPPAQQPPAQEPPTQQESDNQEQTNAEAEMPAVEETTEYSIDQQSYGGMQASVWRGYGLPNETTACYHINIGKNGDCVFLETVPEWVPEGFDPKDGVWTLSADNPEYVSLIPSEDNTSATLIMSGETHFVILFTYRAPNGKTMSYALSGKIVKRS